jgi:hypothetical protein
MLKALTMAIPFLASILSLAASDPWKNKPVREWTREETVQFLRNSPWVRKVTLGGGPLAGGEPLFSPSAFGGPSAGCLGCAHIEPPQQAPRSAGTSSPGGSPAATYFLQWTSARVMRQGFAHLLALQGQGREDSAPAPLDVYVVTVGGSDLQAFEGMDETQLLKDAWIRPRRSKGKVPATRVNVLRGEQNRISVIHFGFPRELEGQPVIPDEEKAVEFQCRCGAKALRAEFELKSMVFEGKRDL